MHSWKLIEFAKRKFLKFQTGHTALQRAAAEGHLDIVKQLVKQGASVDHQDEVVSTIEYIVYTCSQFL